MHALGAATTVAMGLMIGNEAAVSLFINPALWAVDDGSMTRAFARSFGRVMPFWYALCLVLLGAETAVHWREPGRALLLVAVVIWTAVIVATIAVLVPLNNRVATSGDGAGPWRELHRRWDTLHRVRVVLLLGAFLCFLRAI